MFASRDRKYIPIHLSTADYCSFCTVRCHIITEEFSYISNICATSSQVRSCLKGPDSCSGHEIVGINQNTCIHTVRFHGIQTQIIADILENLCYHLTRRGSIWLDIRQDSILNHFITLSVVIQNCNRLRQTKQAFTFCHLWLIGINNNYHRIVICQFLRLMGSHKQIIRILRIISKCFIKRSECHRNIVQNNIDLLFHRTCCPVNTDCRTK